MTMNWLRGPAASLIFALSTFVHVAVVLVVSLLKALIPIRAVRRVLNRVLMVIAESWIGVNSWMIRSMTHTRFVVEAPATLRYDGHYLVLANHQSWVDIPVLQAALNRRIPLLRF